MWRVAIDLTLEADPGVSAESRRAFYMAVMRELDAAGALDPDLEGDLAAGVRISVGLDATVCTAIAAIRSAVHGAGGATPDWPPCDSLNLMDDGNGTFVVTFQSQNLTPVPA